jgi:peptidoglycan hydrolase-like protein with peptidoglycan-binding domain
MTIRKRIALAAAALALGSGLAVLPATSASAATYTCHYSTSGDYAHAGYYSGTTVQPSTTVVTTSGIEAQCLLRRSGYNPGTIDGVFGSNSQAAAKAFQKDMNDVFSAGLDEDGKIGKESWPWLRRLAHL